MNKPLVISIYLTFVIFSALNLVKAEEKAVPSLTTADICVRDPFIVTDASTKTYYMFVQMANRRPKSKERGVEVYTSTDLKHWTRPKPVLVLPPEMNVHMVWAPEVHFYQGAWYMFVTLSFNDLLGKPAPVAKDWPPLTRRGTWIFKSDSPTGPFRPHNNGSVTPPDWMALDGTLLIDRDVPYMIFCHEWVELIDGTIDYARLSPDLTRLIDKPQTILAASSAPNCEPWGNSGIITDGPFFYRSPKSGRLFMIWSTYIKPGGYSVLCVHSENGHLDGPWSKSETLYTKDGGHGMLFTSLENKLMLALHQPNGGQLERLVLLEIEDDGQQLRVLKK